MKIAVLGTGNVGKALGRRWGEAGHDICFGAREPQSEEARMAAEIVGQQGRVGTCREAMAGADAILLAIPWDQTRGVLETAESLDGKILLDCINPLTADLSGMNVDSDTAAAELLANWFPTARVVKAFNTLSAATMEDARYGDQQASMFYCGDDTSAKEVVKQLAEELGFDAIDCGPLKRSRELEALAMLYVHLAVFEGWGGDCAFKMLKR